MTHTESQAERDAFEAKCLEAGHNFKVARRGESYEWPWQDAWWRVWKASAEHVRAALPPVAAVPDGWMLMPMEPTKEIEQAYYAAQRKHGFWNCYPVYKDLIAAAPKPQGE
jgi:hypothetical protein